MGGGTRGKWKGEGKEGRGETSTKVTHTSVPTFTLPLPWLEVEVGLSSLGKFQRSRRFQRWLGTDLTPSRPRSEIPSPSRGNSEHRDTKVAETTSIFNTIILTNLFTCA